MVVTRLSKYLLAVMFVVLSLGVLSLGSSANAGSEKPLRVVLIPADGGTSNGTKATFEPLFTAVGLVTELDFEIVVAQDYTSAVEAMCFGQADIAWFGPNSFVTAYERGCAEFLAVDVRNGDSTYRSGIFARQSSELQNLEDLRGRTIALGSMQSTSSFIYPLAMLINAGLDPVEDLDTVRITSSHAQALQTMAAGRADAAGASFHSLTKAINEGTISAESIQVLAVSSPIPNPPLALNPSLDPEIKRRLRDAIATVHEHPGVSKTMIRGYGGVQVDRYETEFDVDAYARALAEISGVDDELKVRLMRKSSGG